MAFALAMTPFGLAEAAPAWVRDVLAGFHGDKAMAPKIAPVSRFSIDGGGGFVLDRSVKPALLRFDDSPEVWALSPSHGPRGDIIFKNDLGEPLLRATRLGGMTVFTPRRPEGSAAAAELEAPPIRLTPLTVNALFDHMLRSANHCSRLARHTVWFEAPNADAGSVALIADSVTIVEGAIFYISRRADGRLLLAKVRKISVVVSNHPAVGLDQGVLIVTIAPTQGYAGRPSSARIMQAFGP
jgi:hypothetical protein